jgi:hypothetical protein
MMKAWLAAWCVTALVATSTVAARASCSGEIGAAKARALVAQCKKATTEGGQQGVCYVDNTCGNIRNEIRDACRAYAFFKRQSFDFCGPYIEDMPQDAD